MLEADGTRCKCDNQTGDNGTLGVLGNPLSPYANPAKPGQPGQIELHLALYRGYFVDVSCFSFVELNFSILRYVPVDRYILT